MSISSKQTVIGLHHYTLRCTESQLPAVEAFYVRHLGLRAGPRPLFDVPGVWLYSSGTAVVHVLGVAQEGDVTTNGSFDHVSFQGVDLEKTRSALIADGVQFDQVPVPGWPIEQLFLRDPTGLKIELTFVLGSLPEFADD
jgi:catechol 2,3-dioxygenase-like lactoylglutathione lyase family enzyme